MKLVEIWVTLSIYLVLHDASGVDHWLHLVYVSLLSRTLYIEAWNRSLIWCLFLPLECMGLDSQHLFFPGADKTINRSISWFDPMVLAKHIDLIPWCLLECMWNLVCGEEISVIRLLFSTCTYIAHMNSGNLYCCCDSLDTKGWHMGYRKHHKC